MALTASRDLYDAHYLLTKTTLDDKALRFAFVVYIGMTKLAPSAISLASIQYDERNLHNRLLPVLRQKNLPRTKTAIKAWAESMVLELKAALSGILPLHDNEAHFISMIRNTGTIEPSLITEDAALQKIVKYHPALQWASMRNKRKQN